MSIKVQCPHKAQLESQYAQKHSELRWINSHVFACFRRLVQCINSCHNILLYESEIKHLFAMSTSGASDA